MNKKGNQLEKVSNRELMLEIAKRVNEKEKDNKLGFSDLDLWQFERGSKELLEERQIYLNAVYWLLVSLESGLFDMDVDILLKDSIEFYCDSISKGIRKKIDKRDLKLAYERGKQSLINDEVLKEIKRVENEYKKFIGGSYQNKETGYQKCKKCDADVIKLENGGNAYKTIAIYEEHEKKCHE